MTDITTLTFDYNALAPDAAATLREQARHLRALVTKTTTDMIEIGRDLMSVKNKLKHGQFTSWVEAEIGISVRTAQGYMRLAILAEGKSATVSLLPSSTARMLAAKAAPPDIVEHVITKAAAGTIVPDRVVKRLISDRHAEQRYDALEAKLAEKKARRPKAAREREERERQEYLAERERKRAETIVRAQAVIDRFPAEDVQFLAETLTWDIFEEFRRLVTEGGAR